MIIEHIMDVITECSDRVAVLDFGRLIADGPVQKVLAEPEVVSCYLGTGCEAARAARHPARGQGGRRPILTLDHVSAGYGHFKALTDIEPRRAPRRGRRPARHQRRRQDHRGARHQRHDPGRGRAHHARTAGTSRRWPRTTSPGSASRTAWRAGTSSPTSPCTRTSCSPGSVKKDGLQDRLAPGLRPVRRARRAPRQVRQAALRRPAADARHRPRPDGRPRGHHLRRDRPRARADDRRPPVRHPRQDPRRGHHDDPHRAERGARPLAGRPRLRAREGHDRAGWHSGRTARRPSPRGAVHGRGAGGGAPPRLGPQGRNRDTRADAGHRRPAGRRCPGDGRRPAGERRRRGRHPRRLQGGHGRDRGAASPTARPSSPSSSWPARS